MTPDNQLEYLIVSRNSNLPTPQPHVPMSNPLWNRLSSKALTLAVGVPSVASTMLEVGVGEMRLR
jgi:hypothetical protein